MYGDYEDKERFRKRAEIAGVDHIPWVRNAINSALFLQKQHLRQRIDKYISIMYRRNVPKDHPFLPGPKKGIR